MAAIEVSRSKKKKQKVAIVKPEELLEARRLEGLLFGTLGNAAGDLGKEIDECKAIKEQEEDSDEEPQKKKPAWVDEADLEIKVRTNKSLRVIKGESYVADLRVRHAKLNPGTEWALLPSERKRRITSDSGSEVDEGEEEDNILRRNDELVVRSHARLTPGLIEVSKMKDGNSEEPSSAVVRSVEFHRNGQILMTAGFDKKLRFFQIDGKRNPKIQSVFLDKFPVNKAGFTPDGSRVVATARRKSFITYDLVQGRVETTMPLSGREERSLESFEASPDGNLVAFIGNEGYILLVSLGTKQLVGTLKMNGSARSLGFTSDGRQLLSCGGDGEIYCWDLSTRRCIHKARDEGGVNNTSLCVSGNDEFFCTGSFSGAVNVYNREEFLSGSSTKPVKTLMNLTTSADNLRFNHDSQILAMSSRMKRDALRLVHVPSFTVFSNWPTPKTPLQYVHSVCFSPGSGYLAAGNASGKVLLYRLRHYDHA